jgi:hypothetical protein
MDLCFVELLDKRLAKKPMGTAIDRKQWLHFLWQLKRCSARSPVFRKRYIGEHRYY